MKKLQLSIRLMLIIGITAPLWMSCSKVEKEELQTVTQTLSDQVQGDWELTLCNDMINVGGSEVFPRYDTGYFWKFFMSTNSPVGEIWINCVHKYHYMVTGNMIRIYNDNTSDGYNFYTLEIINGNTMKLKSLNSGELKLEFSRV